MYGTRYWRSSSTRLGVNFCYTRRTRGLRCCVIKQIFVEDLWPEIAWVNFWLGQLVSEGPKSTSSLPGWSNKPRRAYVWSTIRLSRLPSIISALSSRTYAQWCQKSTIQLCRQYFNSRIEPTAAESAFSAKLEMESLLDWAKENNVSFDSNKSEAILFSGKKKKNMQKWSLSE